MNISYFAKNKHLLILGIAETVSGLGTWITGMAVYSILIFKQGGDVWQSSGIMLAGLLPMLVFSPLAGQLADRFNKKYLMAASELLSGAAILTIFLTQQPGLILLCLAAQAAVSAVMGPSRQALIPALVTNPDELTRANALLQQLASFVKIGAPMLAGLIITLLGPYNAMLLDVISFILSAGILLFLPNVQPGRSAPETAANADSPPVASAGPSPLATLKESAGLRLLFIATFLMIISLMAFDILSSICIRDILQGDESAFGLLIGLVGFGTVLSGFYLMLRKKNVNPWQDFKLGVTLMMCLPGIIGLVSLGDASAFSMALVMVGVFVGGLGVGFFMVPTSTLLQTLSPAPILGRISGYYQTVCVAGQLIAIVGVPLITPHLVSMTALFFVMTAGLGGVVIYTTISLAAMQRRQLTGAPA